MEIVINPFDLESIKEAKKKIAGYKRRLQNRTKKLAERLAELGATYARDYFEAVVYDIDYYDGEPLEVTNIMVTAYEDESDKQTTRFTISAWGKDVAFIEFGAGVHFNGGGDPYHETRPDGIVGIGQYGQGRGKQQSWSYKGADGLSRRTSGTPEQPGMWLSAQEMRSNIEKIAKEVFAS